MANEYDKYYLTENLFGAPYPELVAFYAAIEEKGKLLDLGCGQGRDAISLARLGFAVLGVDSSRVGIAQLNELARKEQLPLQGVVADMYEYDDFASFRFILLDSIFHFGKKERAKEIAFLQRILEGATPGTWLTVCIQDTGHKLKTFQAITSQYNNLELIHETDLIYHYEDQEFGHHSKTKYRMITLNI